MSQFFARYVPPLKPAQSATTSDASSKRKREEQSDRHPENHNAKKQKHQVADTKAVKPKKKRDVQTESKATGSDILKKYSISEFAQGKGEKNIKQRSSKKHKTKESVSHGIDRGQQDGEDSNSTFESQRDAEKHAHVLSKFKKSRKRSDDVGSQQDGNVDDTAPRETTESHGLVPIPQPEPTTSSVKRPTYSTAPIWQSNAIKADHPQPTTFKNMKLSEDILKNLRKHEMEDAFPVQSTVIPLLVDQQHEASYDLCISAATGSGKTLAYVIPVIEALRKRSQRGIRAVIVVPTRELVTQVRESCEICASGSSLRIVTAVGSKTLKEEQEALIEQEEIYDPVEYQRRRNMPVDWSKVNLITELEKARQGHAIPKVDFVTQTHVKADILISTPGRLVDHLKNTEGFNLDDVEWLVVDEADRLLNESYQEWIEVVVPALQSRNATKERDEILTSMHMDLPPRTVRKVLLSATMTRDLSKLNALGLNDPKLIVLGSSMLDESRISPSRDGHDADTGVVHESDDGYSIPPELSETVLTFKDGEEKPLVLLQWLRTYIKPAPHNRHPNNRQTVDSKDLDLTSSSGSDTESDSSDTLSSETSGSSVSSSASTSSDDTSSDESEMSAKRDEDVPVGNSMTHRPRQNQAQRPRVLVFAKSTASASRLSRLVSILAPDLKPITATLTRSTASSASSRKALSSFRNGAVSILVATDRASRGIDVPGLQHVINYDVPGSALTYVHRVGRTARAGLRGHSWTLLEHRAGRWFWNEIGGKGDGCKIQRSGKIQKEILEIEDDDLRERYEQALQKLGEEVRGQ